MAIKITPDQAPGGVDLAQHPTLWGHPMPRWTEDGLVYVPGSHWTPEVHEALILWLGATLDSIKRWIHGPAAYRRWLTSSLQIEKACKQARAGHTEQVSDYSKRVDAILPTIVLTEVEKDQIEGKVTHADRARKRLWAIADATDPKTRPGTMDELASWITKHHVELVMRLALVGLCPLPPEKIKPASVPVRPPGRQAKMDAKPSLDPDLESVF